MLEHTPQKKRAECRGPAARTGLAARKGERSEEKRKGGETHQPDHARRSNVERIRMVALEDAEVNEGAAGLARRKSGFDGEAGEGKKGEVDEAD